MAHASTGSQCERTLRRPRITMSACNCYMRAAAKCACECVSVAYTNNIWNAVRVHRMHSHTLTYTHTFIIHTYITYIMPMSRCNAVYMHGICWSDTVARVLSFQWCVHRNYWTPLRVGFARVGWLKCFEPNWKAYTAQVYEQSKFVSVEYTFQ